MLRVLIVDDEPLIRQGLQMIIPWAELGFSIAGDASNGEEAYIKAHYLKPDIVLMDINMPVMDGLASIQNMRTLGTQAKFILLTGYSDFAYAQKAIHQEVSAYLLKPIDEKQLIALLLELKNTIEHEAVIRNQAHSFRQKEKENLQSQLLGSAAQGDENALESLTAIFDGAPPYYLCSIGSESLMSASGIRYDNHDFLTPFLRRDAPLAISFNVQGIFFILISGHELPDVKKILGDLTKYLMLNLKIPSYIALSRQFQDMHMLDRAYQDCVYVLNDSFYLSMQCIVSYEQAMAAHTAACTHDHETSQAVQIEKLNMAIEMGDFQSISQCIDQQNRDFYSNRLSREKVIGFYTNLWIECFHRACSEQALADAVAQQEKFIASLLDKKNIQLIGDEIKARMYEISNTHLSGDNSSVCQRIIAYVEKNCEKDLSLEFLGELFYYSPAYLGRLFRRETGISFSNYLDDLRIHNAKTLLAQGVRPNDVAARSGYANSSYFFIKFKKIVGMTPAKYRAAAVKDHPEEIG